MRAAAVICATRAPHTLSQRRSNVGMCAGSRCPRRCPPGHTGRADHHGHRRPHRRARGHGRSGASSGRRAIHRRCGWCRYCVCMHRHQYTHRQHVAVGFLTPCTTGVLQSVAGFAAALGPVASTLHGACAFAAVHAAPSWEAARCLVGTEDGVPLDKVLRVSLYFSRPCSNTC